MLAASFHFCVVQKRGCPSHLTLILVFLLFFFSFQKLPRPISLSTFLAFFLYCSHVNSDGCFVYFVQRLDRFEKEINAKSTHKQTWMHVHGAPRNIAM